jgi:hypothetical protein
MKSTYRGNLGILRDNVYICDKRHRNKKSKIIEVRKSVLMDDYSDLLKKSSELKQEVISSEARLSKINELRKQEIKVHGEQTCIDEGFVYLVANSAYPGWIKAGMTIDYEKRLATYNLYSPDSNFEMLSVKWVTNRRFFEKILLEELSKIAISQKGEWFKVDKEKALLLFGNT